jgi:hypothetical protein
MNTDTFLANKSVTAMEARQIGVGPCTRDRWDSGRVTVATEEGVRSSKPGTPGKVCMSLPYRIHLFIEGPPDAPGCSKAHPNMGLVKPAARKSLCNGKVCPEFVLSLLLEDAEEEGVGEEL